MRSSKTGRKTSSVASTVARSAVLLKPIVANILVFNFCEQKFVQHGRITIVIDCNDLFLLIFKENCSITALDQNPHSDSFWVRRIFNVCVRVFSAAYVIILLVYIATKIKDVFFSKIGIFCKSICAYISQPCSSVYTTIFVRRKDKTNYLSKCYYSRNKHWLKKDVRWRILY